MNDELKQKIDALEPLEKLYLSRYLLHSFIEQTEKDYQEHLKNSVNEK